MANVTVVRTASSSQIGSLLSQESASATYLTQVSASSTYLTQSSASTTYASRTNPVFPNDIQVDGQINLLLNQSSPSTYINGFTANGAEFLRVQSGGAIDLDAKSITLAATSAGIEIFGTISHSIGNFNTGGNISATGRITSTNVPAVYAFSNSGSSITDNGVLPFNNAVFNNGNHYNASTSTFTAPVAGKYLVMCKILTNNDSGAADSRIAVNGSRLPAYAGYAVNAGAITSHKQGHIYGIVSLNANDTIQIRAQGTVSFYSNSSTGHSSLNIHLIG
jgi:hypothetical protein